MNILPFRAHAASHRVCPANSITNWSLDDSKYAESHAQWTSISQLPDHRLILQCISIMYCLKRQLNATLFVSEFEYGLKSRKQTIIKTDKGYIDSYLWSNMNESLSMESTQPHANTFTARASLWAPQGSVWRRLFQSASWATLTAKTSDGRERTKAMQNNQTWPRGIKRQDLLR